MVFSNDLPIRQATRDNFTAWCEWFENFEDYRPPGLRAQPAFPLDAFDAEGRAIAAMIQSKMPGWTVVYEAEPFDWFNLKAPPPIPFAPAG